MADAIATPDFALGDSSNGKFIIDLAAPDSAVELGPFVGISMVALVFSLGFYVARCYYYILHSKPNERVNSNRRKWK